MFSFIKRKYVKEILGGTILILICSFVIACSALGVVAAFSVTLKLLVGLLLTDLILLFLMQGKNYV